MTTPTPYAQAPSPRPRPDSSLGDTLRRLQSTQRSMGAPGYEARIDALGRLESVLKRRKEEIAAAISADFGGRSRHESLLAEVYICLSEIRHTREHLRGWMEPQRRAVSAPFLPARAEIRPQPLGVVGIISPWNYPFQLAIAPLVAAVAAGNRVMLKPSELVPQTADLLASLLGEVFTPEHVAVVTGGPEIAEAFSRLAFDHLLFTGSTRVGKAVMRAAAENLTPVTLELGGKSPAIVGEDFPIELAAKRIMLGKLFNAGQTCIAPDYALVPEGSVQPFVDACRAAAEAMYPTLARNPDYTAIVNERHHARLEGYLTEARERGARVVEVNPASETFDRAAHKMAPTLVTGALDDLALMQEELFGPILPIRPYATLGEALDFINDRPRPLALYCFSHSDHVVQRVLRETTSGGVSVNETMLHFAQDDLPFGGVGPSGMGAYHGREGFQTFSNMKPVFYQSRINGAGLLRPPFGKVVETVLKVLIG
jgi:coniferyl-aldehyde dehydrogenase